MRVLKFVLKLDAAQNGIVPSGPESASGHEVTKKSSDVYVLRFSEFNDQINLTAQALAIARRLRIERGMRNLSDSLS